jgi:hypothetical protein
VSEMMGRPSSRVQPAVRPRKRRGWRAHVLIALVLATLGLAALVTLAGSIGTRADLDQPPRGGQTVETVPGAASAPTASIARADRPRRSPAARLPTSRQLAAARRYARSRDGLVSFAVVDSRDKLHCYRCRLRYVSASLVKAMLLVAYLDHLAAEGHRLTASDRVLLDPMIRVSDNAAATAAYWRAGGDPALNGLARRAGMRNFDVFGHWETAQLTAADQARFFAHLHGLTPRRYWPYAHKLLSSVVSWQSWGIPQASRPRWRTLFKGGWRGTGRGELVHQAARLERGSRTMAIAILTDGNPSHLYGRETVRGIAARLLPAAG